MITLPVASIRLTVRLAKVGRSVATGDDDVPVFPLFWAEGAVEVPSKWTTIWSACITKSPLVITTVPVKCAVLSWSLKTRDSGDDDLSGRGGRRLRRRRRGDDGAAHEEKCASESPRGHCGGPSFLGRQGTHPCPGP